MITSNNLQEYLKTAVFKKNKGAMPAVKDGKEVITKFADGSYGYNSNVGNYYWGFGTAYPIMEYAIVDTIIAPTKVSLPAFNDVKKRVPETSFNVDSGLFESIPVLGLYGTGKLEMVVFCKNELKSWWMTDCKFGYEVTANLVGWLELSYTGIVE